MSAADLGQQLRQRGIHLQNLRPGTHHCALAHVVAVERASPGLERRLRAASPRPPMPSITGPIKEMPSAA
jgi:hypothetical protein